MLERNKHLNAQLASKMSKTESRELATTVNATAGYRARAVHMWPHGYAVVVQKAGAGREYWLHSAAEWHENQEAA